MGGVIEESDCVKDVFVHIVIFILEYSYSYDYSFNMKFGYEPRLLVHLFSKFLMSIEFRSTIPVDVPYYIISIVFLILFPFSLICANGECSLDLLIFLNCG